MMLIQIVDILLFLVCALSAWYFLFQLIPKLGKQVALCLLHNMRDRLYEEIERNPYARDSLIISDMEFTLTALIFTIREHKYPVSSICKMLNRISNRNDDSSDNADDAWRTKRYDFELERAIECEEAMSSLKHAQEAYKYRSVPLRIFVFTYHPFILAVAMILVPIALILGIVERFISLAHSDQKRAESVNLKPVKDSIRTVRKLEQIRVS